MCMHIEKWTNIEIISDVCPIKCICYQFFLLYFFILFVCCCCWKFSLLNTKRPASQQLRKRIMWGMKKDTLMCSRNTIVHAEYPAQYWKWFCLFVSTTSFEQKQMPLNPSLVIIHSYHSTILNKLATTTFSFVSPFLSVSISPDGHSAYSTSTFLHSPLINNVLYLNSTIKSNEPQPLKNIYIRLSIILFFGFSLGSFVIRKL